MDSDAAFTEVVINPAEAYYAQEPVGKEGLTYNGGSQDTLDTLGTSKLGTVLYAATNSQDKPAESSYSADMPTAVNADTYYIHYYIKSSSSNYYDSQDKYLTVTVSLAFIDNIKITGSSLTTDFNGAVQKVEGFTSEAESPLFDSAKVRKTDGSAVARGYNTGTYNMNLQASSFEYSDSNIVASFEIEQDGYLKINKKNVQITVTGARETRPYNGQEQRLDKVYYSSDSPVLIIESKIIELTHYEARGTNNGGYRAILEPEGFAYDDENDNFNVTFVVAESNYIYLSISQVHVNVEVYGNDAHYIYDGQYHSVEGYDASTDNPAAFELDKLKYHGSTSCSFVNVIRDSAGEIAYYGVGLDRSHFYYDDLHRNVFIDSITVKKDACLYIHPRQINVNIVGNHQSKAYDGQPLTVEGYTASSEETTFYNPENIHFNGIAKATQTQIGKSYMNLDASQFSYYGSDVATK